MDAFKGSPTALVADVDCTAAGKELCSEHGVRGYPTIKYGDPSALEAYEGARSYDALKKFADENLGPSCGPANLDLCDADKKAMLEKFMAMPSAELATAITEKTASLDKLEADFKTFVEGLQKQYQTESKKHDEAQAAIKDGGLGFMKAAEAYLKKSKKEEL